MLIADYHHKDDNMSDLSEMIYDLCAKRDLLPFLIFAEKYTSKVENYTCTKLQTL